MKTFRALLLLALTVPAVASPFALRPEVAVSAPEYGISRSISRGDARIATNGDEYLAVWTDSRLGGEPSLYAARMRADGTVLDPLGLRIATGAHAGPVVWTGSKYLIAYETEPAYRGYVRTMTPDGVFGEPIAVGRDARWGSMATNGTNVLLVLPHEAMLLDLEGSKLRDVPLAELGIGKFYTQVAAAGSDYLVAVALPNVVVQAVSSDGVVAAPQTLAEPKEHTVIGLASDGERFLVVWPDKRIYAQLVTTEGTPTGPVHKLALTPNANYPGVVWRDGEYLVVFSERHEFVHYAIRVAADGSALGGPKRIGFDLVPQVEIAAHGRGGIALFAGSRAAVFDDASLEGNDVFRRIVDVAVTARLQTNVRLARLGDGLIAAWVEDHRIFLSTSEGSTPVAVLGSNVSLIDVLVDRSNVIWVVWQGNWETVAVSRFRGNLEPIDPGPIYIRTPGALSATAAAAGEGVIALAYEIAGGSDPGGVLRDVVALLLWETGTGLARRDVLLTTQQFADFTPTVAFDGSAFVYGWSHAKGEFPAYSHEPLPDPVIELVGARVAPNGALLDATPVQIADDVGWVTRIDSARGANGVAFAWQENQKSTRVALFGGAPIDLGGPEMSLGELAPHDGGFLLVRGISRRTPALTEVEYFVLGADLSIDATAALPPYEADAFWNPFDIDVIGGASPVFAYVKSANGLYGNVPRVFVRRTGEGAPRRRAVR